MTSLMPANTAPAVTYDKSELELAMSRAKISLMTNYATIFFAHVMLRLAHVFNDKYPTAATNGRTVMYNTGFYMGCTPAERIGLILHETLHCLFYHFIRMGDRDPRLWNMAADYVINLIIVDAGCVLPAGALLDSRFRGLTVEEVYDILHREQPGGNPDHDDLMPPDTGGEDGDPEKLQSEMDNIVCEAAVATQKHSAEAWGAVPADIRRHIDEIMKPTVKWNQLFQPWMDKQYRGNNKTYRKINRRFSKSSLILPTRYRKILRTGAIISDVSGSVSEEQWRAWSSEAWFVLKNFTFEKIWFGQFDTKFHVASVTNEQEFLKIPFTGGGGTDPTPAIEWCQQEQPDWVVIFTDGYFEDLQTTLNMPVIWIVHGNDDWQAPFGKKLKYELPEVA